MTGLTGVLSFVSGALAVGLAWAICALVADNRGRPKTHVFRGQGEAITVADLLDDAAERRAGVRLNWPTDDREFSPIRPDDRGQYPTVILPPISGDGEGQAGGAGG